jgi:septum formation protein
VVPEVAERRAGDPREVVAENARRKAAAVAAGVGPGTLVIAGDTEVVLEDRALGQPPDEAGARAHLEALSGREHEVLGALYLLEPGRKGGREGVEVTRVRFAELTEDLIEAYLGSGEWRGRAGGYAVQGLGSALIEAIVGDVSNVIGLPVRLLATLAPRLLRPARHN